MSNECLICYEYHAELVFLNCRHSMCQICLSKLQKHACPFCRQAIPDNVSDDRAVNNQVERVYPEQIPVIRVRVRRRRRRIRTTTDTMHTEHGTVIIETPHNVTTRRKKPKAGKNNFRRGNWTRANHRNGCIRIK
jgi:hypothetical protein